MSNTYPLLLRIPLKLKKEISKLSEKNMMTVSGFIRSAILMYLQTMTKTDVRRK